MNSADYADGVYLSQEKTPRGLLAWERHADTPVKLDNLSNNGDDHRVKSGHEKHIALVFEWDAGNLHELCAGIRSCGAARNWRLIAYHLPKNIHMTAARVAFDGAFVFAGQDLRLEARQSLHCPMVNLLTFDPKPGMPSVWPDNHVVGRVAAEHLLQLGLQHFGFIGNTRYSSECRKISFVERIGGRAAPDSVSVFCEQDIGPAVHEPRIIAWLKSLRKPCGIMCDDDRTAIIVNNLCTEGGLRVPDEIALIGVNNAPMLVELADPPLTSVRLPHYAIGMRAAEFMDDLLHGRCRPSANRICLVDSDIRVIARESTGIVAFSDADIAAVVRYIREEAPACPLYADGLRRRFKMSRKAMESGFLQWLGVSPAEEIARVREQRACTLLTETDWSIKRIALEMGFRSGEDLARFLRRRTGRTPSEWKAQTAR